MTGDIKDRKFERKEINKELTSRLLCEVRDGNSGWLPRMFGFLSSSEKEDAIKLYRVIDISLYGIGLSGHAELDVGKTIHLNMVVCGEMYQFTGQVRQKEATYSDDGATDKAVKVHLGIKLFSSTKDVMQKIAELESMHAG